MPRQKVRLTADDMYFLDDEELVPWSDVGNVSLGLTCVPMRSSVCRVGGRVTYILTLALVVAILLWCRQHCEATFQQ